MLASGGIGSGLGVLLFMPVVGVALYGKRWESAITVGRHPGRHPRGHASPPRRICIGTTPRRLFLTGSIAAMLSVAIHTLRGRLLETSARTARLLHHEEALNAAARQLVQLSEPPQITALGAELALGIASPRGSEILRASYFRIEDGMVVLDAQFDQVGTVSRSAGPSRSTPVFTRRSPRSSPSRAASTRTTPGPTVRRVMQ